MGFREGAPFNGPDVITWPADVLIPAALEDAITEDNAADVRATLIVEGANGPTTPKADEILLDRGIVMVPDILANAGGVTVSYFEWAQNIQQFRWELDRITGELEKVMVRAYAAVRDVANEKSVDLRTAAFVLGVRRVGSRGPGATAHPQDDHLRLAEPRFVATHSGGPTRMRSPTRMCR